MVGTYSGLVLHLFLAGLPSKGPKILGTISDVAAPCGMVMGQGFQPVSEKVTLS